MTAAKKDVLILRLGATSGQDSQEQTIACLAEHLPGHQSHPEVMNLAPESCHDILERLSEGALPVVLKPPRQS